MTDTKEIKPTYYELNKERLLNNATMYYETNREKILERQKIYNETVATKIYCDICNENHYKFNYERHLTTKKHKRNLKKGVNNI